jgi:4-alpha-glucanotransferase
MIKPSLSTRSAGILLHPTSLPGAFGAGDLGPTAYRFARDLQNAGLRWWQMLPITPPGPAPEFSPYSSCSAFAGSPWLVSPELLYRDGLISKRELSGARRPTYGRIDFSSFRKMRSALLRKAFEHADALDRKYRRQMEQFAESNTNWLDDYSLFAALKESLRDKCWARWPADLRLRKPSAIAAARQSLASSVAFHRFVQWLFDRQWSALKKYCNERGIGLIGDIPIFIAHDSAAVWARQDLFLLDPGGNAIAHSGYPPDIFSPLGQVWGHPHYRWPAHIAEGFKWWTERFQRLLRQFDAIRVDHFLGFHRVWAVPASAKNAVHGKWLAVPGSQLFAAVHKRLGNVPIIAEDLGNQTPQAIALRDKYKFPGMRILQFAFGDGDYHSPHAYPKASVAYTGTHDNQTLVAWLQSLRSSPNGELTRALTYVGAPKTEPHWSFIRALFASPAQTVIVPVQDVLGLGAEHRMNVPGILRGNWGWRMSGPLPQTVVRRVREICDATRRLSTEQEIQVHEKLPRRSHRKTR